MVVILVCISTKKTKSNIEGFFLAGFLGLTLLIIFVNYFCLENLIFLLCRKSFLMYLLKLLGLEFCASKYMTENK